MFAFGLATLSVPAELVLDYREDRRNGSCSAIKFLVMKMKETPHADPDFARPAVPPDVVPFNSSDRL